MLFKQTEPALEIAVETARIFAAAYEEGRDVGLFW
jgi:hypothetical protein